MKSLPKNTSLQTVIGIHRALPELCQSCTEKIRQSIEGELLRNKDNTATRVKTNSSVASLGKNPSL